MRSSSSWKQIRYRFEWGGLILASKLVPLLSRSACFHLANFLGTLMSIFDRPGRRVALNNLEVAFGDQLSMAQRRHVTRESFQHFARSMLDLMWTSRLNAENYSKYIEFVNYEEAFSGDTGQIVACFHYSNFEWLSIGCGFRGVRAHIAAQEFKNSLLDPIFKDWRELSGHAIVPSKGGVVRLTRAVQQKGTVALLVDLTVPPERRAVVIDCLGLKTCVTSAHAWLQEQTGAPIVPAHCEPLPGGRYRIVFHPKIEPTAGRTAREVAQECWNSFEHYLRQRPAPWLWMYKHWRYRPARADRPYPFYSQGYEDFDQLAEDRVNIRRYRRRIRKLAAARFADK